MARTPEFTADAIKSALIRGDFYASTGVTLEDYSASDKQGCCEDQQLALSRAE